jgi:hypothetical protein
MRRSRANRHHLLAEMERLQADFSVPIKQLGKRVGLLTEIRTLSAGTELAELSTDQLKQWIECIETIHRLEPEGQRVSITPPPQTCSAAPKS